MRKFKFEQINSSPFRGLDGSVIFHDGTDPTHRILIESVDGLGVPLSNVQTQQSPFQVGASPIRTNYGPRTIAIAGVITIDCKSASGKAQMETIKRDLGNKFSPIGMGYVPNNSTISSPYSTVTGKLSFAADGVNFDRFIDCVPISATFPDRLYSDGFQRFMVQFFCPNPTWYGATVTATLDTPSTVPSGTFFEMGYSESLGYGLICSGTTVYKTFDGINFETCCTVATTGGNIVWDAYRSQFIMLGTVLRTSPTGSTWTDSTGAGALTVATALPDKIIAFSSSAFSTAYYYSTDGLTMTAGTLPASVKIVDCVWADGLGVVCIIGTDSGAVNRAYYSYNGITWYTTTLSAVGTAPTSMIYANSVGKLVAFFGSSMEVSSTGITFGAAVSLGDTYKKPAWSSAYGILMAAGSSSSGQKTLWSENLTSVTGVTNPFVSYGNTVYMSGIGVFTSFPTNGGSYPSVSYNGKNIYQVSSASFGSIISVNTTYSTPTTTAGPVAIVSGIVVTVTSGNSWTITNAGVDFTKEIENDGDIPASFRIRIPIIGNETGKKIIISDNFIWDGAGTPPTDKNIVISTDGLQPGYIDVDTYFAAKDIKQFGISKIGNLSAGNFFTMFVSGDLTNHIYVHNTGVTAGPPIISWENRYLGV